MKTNTVRKVDSSRVQLFLRIKHPSLDPATISNAIGIEPEHAVRAGESISAKGKPALHSESYWIAQLSTPVFPVSIAAEALQDYRALLSTSSVAEKIKLQTLYFERHAHTLQGLSKGLSKEQLIALIGASPIELMIVPWLRKWAACREFLASINAAGGSVTLVIQLRNVEPPLRIRPTLARQLADAGIELEIDWNT